MKFDHATMGFARVHEVLRDSSDAERIGGDVPIVEFSADQPCDQECDSITFDNLTYRNGGRSCALLRDASTHDVSAHQTTNLFCMMRFGKRGRQGTFCDAEDSPDERPVTSSNAELGEF
jgi:hypothetical protein